MTSMRPSAHPKVFYANIVLNSNRELLLRFHGTRIGVVCPDSLRRDDVCVRVCREDVELAGGDGIRGTFVDVDGTKSELFIPWSAVMLMRSEDDFDEHGGRWLYFEEER